jgi:hypothetical protein
MTSTGNDIVALSAISLARTLRPEFYSRIVTPGEHHLYHPGIQSHLSFEHFVWLAWSVKESAFKYLKRLDTAMVFSPSKMRIQALVPMPGQCHGTVRSGDQILYFQSVINGDFIFSIVNDSADFSGILWDVKRIKSVDPRSQSAAVRALLLARLGLLFPGSELQLAKSPHGWPVIVNDGEELPVAVSFTHHDHYVAYSLQSTDSLWTVYQHHAEVS